METTMGKHRTRMRTMVKDTTLTQTVTMPKDMKTMVKKQKESMTWLNNRLLSLKEYRT